MKTGIELIESERIRQITEEGHSHDRDDGYSNCELYMAANCYRTHEQSREYEIPKKNSLSFFDIKRFRPIGWPWLSQYWKPCPDNRVRELVKAGALYMAEMQRIDRLIKNIASEIDRINKLK